MQLPQEFHGVDRPPRCHVPLPLLRLLQDSLHGQERAKGRRSLHGTSSSFYISLYLIDSHLQKIYLHF